MKELSLHILDIVQNSLKANASRIEIQIIENLEEDRLIIDITDNGKGMRPSLLEIATDPFTTTRNNRRVGLGLSLLKSLALQCQGDFSVESKKGVGTRVYTALQNSHIDRPPLGNIEDTFITLFNSVNNNQRQVEYIYKHQINDRLFEFDTSDIKKIIGNVSINDSEVLIWMKNYLKENLERLVKS